MSWENKKNLFKKIFITKKSSLVLISILVILGLFIALKPAQAFVFDYAAAIEGLLDFLDGILRKLVFYTIYAFISAIYVIFAAHLLEWAFTLPVYLNSNIVLAGWTFIRGLVNLFFVIALVLIAFAYILKIETWQMKKALPRLIIVILLVNFSLLLVGIVVDISEFVMNTFRTAFGTDFVTMAIQPLQNTMGAIIHVLSTVIVGYIASTIGIYTGVAFLIWFGFDLFAGTLLGDIFQVFLLIALNMILGSIFFMYFILFLGRIVALWLLAITSPLAFFCWIFPQTQKFTMKWFHALVQWAFMGVVALFLLGLITTLFNQTFTDMPPAINIGAMAGIGGFSITDALYSYLFLAVFLAFAWHVTKKYVPVGATEAIGLIKGAFVATGLSSLTAKNLMNKVRQAKTFRKGEEKIAKGLGRIPGVGPDILASHREKQRKEIATEREKMGLLTPEERRKAFESKLTSSVRGQATSEIMAEKGELEAKDLTRVKRFVALGADPTIYEKTMPSWTGELREIAERKTFKSKKEEEEWKAKAIQEATQKQSPKQFQENVQPEGINREVVINMSVKQATEVMDKGSIEQRGKIFEGYIDELERRGIKLDKDNLRRDVHLTSNIIAIRKMLDDLKGSTDLQDRRFSKTLAALTDHAYWGRHT